MIPILLFARLLFGSHAWDCFVVSSIQTNPANSTYVVSAQNNCDRSLPSVVVLVKFMDKDGNRIGAGAAFVASYVAPHEKFRRECNLDGEPASVKRNLSTVLVRAIREDMLDALK